MTSSKKIFWSSSPILLQVSPSVNNINTKTSTPTSKYKSTPETTNLARVARLILGPCTDLLRDILKRKIPPSDLSKTVKTWIDDLKKNKIKNPLNKQQIALIFPLPNKQHSGDYSDLDISLLYILLRNVCKITPHNKGWGEEPDPTDNSVSASIERIRLTRNKYYGHAADFSLTQSNFIKEWQNIYNITVELEQHIGTLTVYQDAVNDIRACSMDPEIEAKYIDKLLLIDELCETVKSHTEEIKKLQQDALPNVKDEIKELQHAIPPNVKDLHEKQLQQWREEDLIYSETHTFQEMLNKVRGQPYMTFVGVPGSGKSATIHHIALILQDEGHEVIPIIEISEIYRYCDSHNPQVFVIDDVVGVLGLQKQKLETLVDYEKIISHSIKGTKVLMSCREAVFKECYKSFFINEGNVIKLYSAENALNDDDKIAILQTHGLDKDLLSPTLLRKVSTMFPLLCKLVSKEANFKNNIERFFTCPTACILKEFDKMQEQNRLQYATLVLCLLNGNKLSKEILKETENKVFYEMKRKTLEKCEVESYTDSFKFVKALLVMEGTYTKLCGFEYTFIHDSMFEIIAHHFGSQFPKLILQFMSTSYIANYVKLQKYEMLKLENEYKQASEKDSIDGESKNEKNIACKSSQKGEKEALSAENSDRMESFDLCIRLGEDLYSRLAERLYRDIENMELYDVFMNDILKHPSVCQAFIEVLKAKSYSELKSLFLSIRKDVSKVVSKGERVREEIEKRDGWSREWDRQRLLVNARRVFVNEKYDKTEMKYSVRVIRWVVYYGHNQLLQYILEQTECHKETQSELFLNSFKLALLNPTIEEGNKTAANDPVENLRSFIDLDIDGSISEHQRLLELSCYNGDLETVKTFIRYFKRNTIYTTFPDLKFKFLLGDEALQAACMDGHLSVVKELIEAGADVNPQDVYETPLTIACEGGYTSIVKELIEAGAVIDQKAHYGSTPLTAACYGGYISIVKELLGARADVNLPGEYDTPLTAACKGGYISIVKELIEAGSDINRKVRFHKPLTAACEGGHLSVVKELIEAGADINRKGEFHTPLTAACEGGHMSVVKELIEAGADINQQDNYKSTLTAACESGHISIVKVLIEAGADINQNGHYGYTPLIAACEGGYISIVKELLGARADVNLQGTHGIGINKKTPLTVACKGGHFDIVKELLVAGADVNQEGNNFTPLTAACWGGHINEVKELMEAGADVNVQSKIDSPLTAAINGGNIVIVKELLSAGASVNPQDTHVTPLIAACKGGHESFVRELLGTRADVNLHSTCETPLIAACYCGHMSIVMDLLKAGADVNLQIKSCTPLIAACLGGHEDVVEEIVNAGVDVNLHGNFYNSLNVGVGNLIELFDKDESYTPLTLVCGGGYMRGVKSLLKAGADVNPRDEYLTPLIAAIKGGYICIIKELLSAGADLNLQAKHKTPLITACDSGHMNIVMELLNAGADVHLHDGFYTPLTAACEYGHVDAVKELLQKGTDVNPQGQANTPLTLACRNGHTSIVIELMKAGADVNLQSNYDTPLTATCKNGYINITKILLDSGSDVNMQDKQGNTPLYKAFVNINKIFIHVMLEIFDIYGADSTISNKEGISIVYIALIRNEISSIKHLLGTVKESQLDRLRLHLFECLVNIRHSDVMTDSKDDVVVTRRRVWRMEYWGDLYKAILESDSKGLKHLVGVGLDINQWIQLYNDSNDEYDERPLLFTLIDVYDFDDSLLDKVRILLESGVDVNVRVRYREYDSVLDRECGSVLDREGVSVLERTRQLLNKRRKSEYILERFEVFKYTRVIKEVKKHVRRYSV
ncbi:rabankyrin-5-like [Saccostrea cucullata]|uniref:rabankyrin-5-like n=1 Tax=Saccostrea cuccullata TaxID=36930 RepID=UPI002ED48F55